MTLEEHLLIWPNCSVADCEYKAYIPDSEMCYSHMRGVAPMPMDEYLAQDSIDEEPQ
jgi:hypothetical protein